MRNIRGFTLIELMIVVAIIAALASIAISIYQQSTGKAQLSEAFTIADGIKADVADYYNQTGQCPTPSNSSLSPATSYSGKYVIEVDVTDTGIGCTITAHMRNVSVSPQLQGRAVVFTMLSSNGAVNWQCSSDANPVYLPVTCR